MDHEATIKEGRRRRKEPEAGHVVGAKFNNAVSTLEQTIYAREKSAHF